MLASILTTVFFSLSAVFANRSIAHLGSAKANLSRLLFATACLAIYSHFFAAGLQGRGLSYFLWSGVIGFGLGDLALFQTLPRLGSRLTILMTQCLAAPLGAFIEWLWLGTTLSTTQVVSGLAILAGVAIAVAPKREVKSANADAGTDALPATPSANLMRWGLVFGFFSALGQGWGAVISRKAFEIDAAHGLSINGVNAAYQRILGGVAVAVVAYLILGGRFDLTSPTDDATEVTEPHRWRRASPWIFLNALCGPLFGVSCYQWALGQLPTGIVLSVVATTPLVIMPFSFALEDDKPTWRSAIGAIIAVAGVVALAVSR